MPLPRNTGRDQTVVRGLQEFLVIDSAPAGAGVVGQLLKDVGNLTVAGTYQCYVDVPGLANVYAELKPSAVSGTFAPSFFSTYADGVTARTTAAGAANFAAATAQSLTITLAGERRCIVQFTIPGGGSINFSTRAEATGL
jgi:hypothetical protein